MIEPSSAKKMKVNVAKMTLVTTEAVSKPRSPLPRVIRSADGPKSAM
jgi:hypothetical protein